MRPTRDEVIQELDCCGYNHGDKFRSEAEVREYFQLTTLREVFGERDCEGLTQELLDACADLVIREHRHMV
jgi:hypothetical protein